MISRQYFSFLLPSFQHAHISVLAYPVALQLPSEPHQDSSAKLEVVNRSHPGGSPSTLCMLTALRSSACTSATVATIAEFFGEFRRVGHEAGGLLDRGTGFVFASVHALIACCLDDARIAHHTLYDVGLP